MAKKKDNMLAFLIVVGIVLVFAGIVLSAYGDYEIIGTGIIASGIILAFLSGYIRFNWRLYK